MQNSRWSRLASATSGCSVPSRSASSAMVCCPLVGRAVIATLTQRQQQVRVSAKGIRVLRAEHPRPLGQHQFFHRGGVIQVPEAGQHAALHQGRASV